MSREDAWRFFANARNLPRLSPPAAHIEILGDPPEEVFEGMILTHRMRPILNLPLVWVSRIVAADKPDMFADEQQKGPFRFWRHEHMFRDAPGGTEVTDRLTYAIPLGPLGDIAHTLFVRRQLLDTFAFRRKALTEIFGSLEPEA